MSYIIRILQNGDGLWFVAGYDPHPFTISLTETYDEAVEDPLIHEKKRASG